MTDWVGQSDGLMRVGGIFGEGWGEVGLSNDLNWRRGQGNSRFGSSGDGDGGGGLCAGDGGGGTYFYHCGVYCWSPDGSGLAQQDIDYED